MRRTLLGIGFTCMAASLWPVMLALVKELSPRYGTEQLVWARQLSHLVFLLALFGPARGVAVLRTSRFGWQLVRSVTLAASIALLYAGGAALPLAKTASINLTGPLFVAVLAGPLLGERLGWSRILAVAIGLLGALLIIRPTSDVFHPASLLIVGASLCYALFQCLTRFVGRTDGAETSAVYSVLVGTILLSIYVPFAWTPIASGADAALMFLVGALGGCGHYCLARALRYAPASLLAPFHYWQLVAAIFVGYVVSGDLPDLDTGIGALVIVAAGLFLGWKETRPALPDAETATSIRTPP